jgi:hypothetical protein
MGFVEVVPGLAGLCSVLLSFLGKDTEGIRVSFSVRVVYLPRVITGMVRVCLVIGCVGCQPWMPCGGNHGSR